MDYSGVCFYCLFLIVTLIMLIDMVPHRQDTANLTANDSETPFTDQRLDSANLTAHADSESSFNKSEAWTVYMQTASGQTGAIMCNITLLNVVLKITGRKGVYHISDARHKANFGLTKAFDTSYFPFNVTNGNIS